MTIFNSLFQHAAVRNRHSRAPLCRERAEYLTHVQALGHQECTINLMASYLLHVNRVLGLSKQMRRITIDELENAGRKWETYTGPLRRRFPGKTTYELFMQTARSWLRFHSCLIEPPKTRFADERLRDYERWLNDERGLASSTTKERSKHALYFLKWLAEHRVSLRGVNPSHVEHYLQAKKAAGLALATRVTHANSLRNFLRYSEARGSVRVGLCEAVPRLVRSKYAFKQKGPSWRGVRRMISSLNRVTPIDIRDHAMVLLMAVYGLRAGEIRALRITDVDLENRILAVGRKKNHSIQRFPLNSEVSSAIQKYMNRARPASERPSLFLTTGGPGRPISGSGLYCRVSRLFRRSGVESLHKGPHALRHACANRLMDNGATVRDIAAFLGHRDFTSVREYARYNSKHLRQIAEFSLDGLV